MPGARGYVSGVEFYRLGQAGILARYPWHWHWVGDWGSGQYIRYVCLISISLSLSLSLSSSPSPFCFLSLIAYHNSRQELLCSLHLPTLRDGALYELHCGGQQHMFQLHRSRLFLRGRHRSGQHVLRQLGCSSQVYYLLLF